MVGLTVALLSASLGATPPAPRTMPAQPEFERAEAAFRVQDWAAALRDYEAAANAGHVMAAIKAARMHRASIGTPRDDQRALKWLLLAAKADEPLGWMANGWLNNGWGGRRPDYRTALRWFVRAAASGEPLAWVNLAVNYEQGWGVPPNGGLAFRWCHRAARAGDAAGEYELGRMHREGVGTKRDAEAAVRWYRRAAAHGEARAMEALGECYRDGAGVERSLPQAEAWFRRSGAVGNHMALNSLGRLYKFGAPGLKPDRYVARRWFNAAVALNCPQGRWYLRQMNREEAASPGIF